MTTNNKQSFKIWFKIFLIRRDLKLCIVATRLGISASHLSNIVNGRKQAKGNFCSNFKAIYKEDISQFLPETPKRK
jgi:transcriptional regulator with XRE-family HTH domain